MIDIIIFVKNVLFYVGIGYGIKCILIFIIVGFIGEGLIIVKIFVRKKKCVYVDFIVN